MSCCKVVARYLRQVKIRVDHFLVVESRTKLLFCFSI